MDENKKEYSVVGTVTIGTDEYRDILKDKFEAEKTKAEKTKAEYNNKWYNEYQRANQLQEQVDALTAKIQKEDIIRRCTKSSAENKEESAFISVIMSLFGEE